jgi:DNA-binding Xre family transcriptional regulator/CheY-like chemotaxis protein
LPAYTSGAFNLLGQVLLAVDDDGGELVRLALELKHQVTVVTSLSAATRLLATVDFDAVICDVCFDCCQVFELWKLVRERPNVAFLAYKQRHSELGEAMETIVEKAVLNMGMECFELQNLLEKGNVAMLGDFIELHLRGYGRKTLCSKFGRAVKQRRLKLGVSLEDLSQRTGISLSILSDLESGRGSDLELIDLFEVCAGVNIAPSELLQSAEQFED